MTEQKKEIEVRIYSLATTPTDAIVFLEEVNGVRLLPIWIGPVEGQAIAIKFSGIPLPRPFTHDLMLSVITAAGLLVEKVVIDNIKENTFYASVHLKKGEERFSVDSRPSDAIALAVRAGCQIYISEIVLGYSQVLNKPISEDEVRQFKEQLRDLKPKDIFGQDKQQPGGAKPPDADTDIADQ